MALPPQYSGHRWGPANAVHVLEAYLDYVCPFSARLYKRLRSEVFPYIKEKYPGKVQFIFRQQVQPWHPFSTVVHEAAIAVEKIDAEKYFEFSDRLFDAQKEFYDEIVHLESRQQTNLRLAKYAEQVGIDSSKFLDLLDITPVKSAADAKNLGNKVTVDLKYHIKLARQTSIHVSPTVLHKFWMDHGSMD
ncbi:5109_t:CDS:2 [Entrophospora sp. SA101]|nr:5109_t:CDS:2 [Entrophospora sp. SA101]